MRCLVNAGTSGWLRYEHEVIVQSGRETEPLAKTGEESRDRPSNGPSRSVGSVEAIAGLYGCFH